MRLTDLTGPKGPVLLLLIALAVVAAGCGASRTYNKAEAAARTGDWDAAVEYYRRAVQQAPERSDYKIALERSMINASHEHLNQAQLAEARGELEEALREYRRASDFDPPNRQLAAKVMEIERRIRDQYEARPPNNIAQLREQARQAGPPPLIKLNEVLPEIRFNNTSIRDILNFIANATGINVTYDRDYQDRAYTVQLNGVTLEQALNQILSANLLFYKVINQNTIMVIPDNAQKRANYEEQVIRTFYISHSDATELSQMINTIIRVPAMAVQPMVAPNKTNNTITIRATTAVAAIIEKMIDSNDKPRAEIVIDVQILEISRERARQFGVDLGSYAINAVFSPESDPRGTSGTGAAAAATLNTQPTFNLNTITRGVSTADFYLAVPSAVVRFLETDSDTKLIAKPQLRGAEGQKITLNLGDDIPVPSTVFTPLATGGANTNPLTSFSYRTVGIVVEMTPRVTVEGEVILDLSVENSTRSGDVNVAGQNLPSFGTRKVVTRLRLRDGESNLLAGLLREDERQTLRGLPGILRMPIVNKLFAANDTDVRTNDIVMLLTPRIVRTQEITAGDLSPIFIGTQQNLGLNGPPPLIQAPPEPAPGAPAAPAVPPGAQPAPAQPPAPNVAPPGGAANAAPGISIIPPGSSPVPGTTAVTAAPAPVVPGGAPPPPAAGGAPPAAPSAASPSVQPAGAQVIVTPPGTDFRVGGGPYTVAISATNASRLSGLSLTITFNPAALRVRAVQEGSFMRAGGAQATFTQMVDAATGRIDIAIVRTGDATGVAGTGLLAAVLFDAVGGGAANLAVTGTATAPGGTPASLQMGPVPAVTVR